MRKRHIQSGLLIGCLVCLAMNFMPGKCLLVREGLLVTGAALWLARVELRRMRPSDASIKQVLVMLALGVLLWKAGGIQETPAYIWGAESARMVMLDLLMQTVGMLVVPACFGFYLCTPRRACIRRIPQVKRLPRTVQAGYRAAV